MRNRKILKKELTDSKKSVRIKMSKERLKGDDMENKLTYNVALETAIEAVGRDTETGMKLVALQEQLAHKASTRKPKVNQAKLDLADKVTEIMEPGVAYRTAELAEVLDVSTQKLAPALKVAVENGTVEKIVEKRVAKYQLKAE